MRKTLLFLMLLSVKLTFGQVSDDFSDGNFDVNPSWIGNDQQFFVNSSKQLQTSLSAVGQTVMLSVPNALALNVEWEFSIQLNFDPSTSNQAKIYLIADKSDLNVPLNGYFIQIGENGNTDSYDLYRQTGKVITKIIDGAAKARPDAGKLLANIRVTRNEMGKWELYSAPLGNANYSLEGEATDLTHVNTNWFGISCKYTTTRSNGFIFDNISVSESSPDLTPPTLLSAKVLDEHTIAAVFSEPLEPSSALTANFYRVNILGNPQSVSASSPTVYHLNYMQTLPSGDYKLTIRGVKDLKGNPIEGNNEAAFFYLQPYELKNGDLLISEILVNPKSGGVDFVEIYNATDQILDLKALRLANVDVNGNVANVKNVSATSVYMPAKTYWVLTSDPTRVKANYEAKFPDQFIQMSMPAYNNDKGSVILLGNNGTLERLDYNEGMHHPLLKNVDGVALERVSFKSAANEPGNFTSAAMSSGYATPTYRNFWEENTAAKNGIFIANRTFSPDGDGFEDLLQIDYNFSNTNNLVTINIYTDKGVLVRKLVQNNTVATTGSFTWDGLNDHGMQSKVGIYIVKVDAFTLDGKSETFRKPCVLAARLSE